MNMKVLFRDPIVKTENQLIKETKNYDELKSIEIVIGLKISLRNLTKGRKKLITISCGIIVKQ